MPIKQVMIKCPVTGIWIHTGIAMDDATFEASSLRNNTVHCSQCGNHHVWSKSDAQLRLPETPAAN
jgi:uncharacterized protein YlaI